MSGVHPNQSVLLVAVFSNLKIEIIVLVRLGGNCTGIESPHLLRSPALRPINPRRRRLGG